MGLVDTRIEQQALHLTQFLEELILHPREVFWAGPDQSSGALQMDLSVENLYTLIHTQIIRVHRRLQREHVDRIG